MRILAASLAHVALCLGATTALAGDTRHAGRSDLGHVDFRVSCAAEVREDFDRAVALVHHMMYVEARSAFEAIADARPDCAMAQWGIAKTLFQPLWPTRPSADDLERGRAALRKARELGPGSERERALLAAAEAFFRDPEAGWWTRIERWSQAMQAAYEAHPKDNDIAAFYGLSRIAAGQTAAQRAKFNDQAAQVLLAIHAREPSHPGAIHYLIHANDIEQRASESLEVVAAYDEIAPSVPHALHMPTHIYVRLGKWPEVIEWNRRSADAALEHPAGDAVSHHHAHAADYLVYAHLQRGDDTAARAVVEEVAAAEGYQPTFISAFHLAAVPARYAVERRDWQRAVAIEPRTPSGLPWDDFAWPEALSWVARGLGALHTGDLEGAVAAHARLEALRDGAEAAGERDFARYIEIDRLILAGRIAQARDRSDEAVVLLRRAAKLEGEVEKHPVSPGALLPPYEALGELLLELDRPDEALAAFQASQEIWPGRYWTLLGAARAAAAAGDEASSRRYYAQLLETTAPDSERPGVAEAVR